jgi:hypothetical protein
MEYIIAVVGFVSLISVVLYIKHRSRISQEKADMVSAARHAEEVENNKVANETLRIALALEPEVKAKPKKKTVAKKKVSTGKPSVKPNLKRK